MKKISSLALALLALGLFMTCVEMTEGKCWEYSFDNFSKKLFAV